MPAIKEGDRVRIVAREPTDEDAKSALYFGYYGGLTGTVQKVYSKQEVAIEVDPESLPRDIRKRHEEIRDQMKTKWLDGLSEEGRSRLTEREKDFHLRYVLLVAMNDLEKTGRKPGAVASAVPPAGSSAPLVSKEESGRAAPVVIASAPEESEDEFELTPPPAPTRKTTADLEAAEEAEFQRRTGFYRDHGGV